MHKLIVTSDDCGLSNGINLATVELVQSGRVTAASVMTNFPAAQHALELFSSFPNLDVGVHLNLTDGSPLTRGRAASNLTGSDGKFQTRAALIRRALAPSPSFLTQVENELTAQVDVFSQAGLDPKHLTTHLHFHLFPALREIVFKLARRFHVAWVRPFQLSAAVVPFNPLLRRQSAPTKPGAVESVVPNYLAVLNLWMRYNPDRLLRMLQSLPGTVELVVHPCLAQDDTFPPAVRYPPRERFKETQFLERFWQDASIIRDGMV